MKDQRSQNSTSQSQRQRLSKRQLALGFARSRFRKVWDVRGGGLYAVGYILTFLFFEARTFVEEIAGSSGIVDFLTNQLFEFALRFVIGSFENMIKAFMWPVYIVRLYSPFGAIALGLAFVVFPKYLKKPIEKWLFDESERP